MFNIVLVSPEIPPNTGNVMRLCANAGCSLSLVKPMGFELDDAKLKRAGMDYREFVDVRVFESFSDCANEFGAERMHVFSKFHERSYAAVDYRPGDTLVFGSETSGLPESIRLAAAPQRRLKLPMMPGNRSLNLSNAVAIATYEAWRQNGFAGS